MPYYRVNTERLRGNIRSWDKSIAGELALEASQSYCRALDEAEGGFDVQVVDIRGSLTKDNEVILLCLVCIRHHEVFNAGLLGPPLKIQYI